MQAILALEDGRVFTGEAFGAAGLVVGEVCFNTSMTGYQEVLTDPSYCGQLVAMTYPEIGNYGTNALDQESSRPHVRGFVIEDLSPIASNWRSDKSLHDYLVEWDIPGIQGIDTRALTRHLRTRGAMKACLATGGITEEEAVRQAVQGKGVVGMDYVREVTVKEPYIWDPESKLSRRWTLVKGQFHEPGLEVMENGQAYLPLPPVKHRVVAYDFGMKQNILRMLRQEGFEVEVVPAGTSAEDVLARGPDGIFLSNGPGDPGALDYIHANVRKLLGKKPMFGICLGHQILGFAYGGGTFKLKFGHRGANQPVKDLRSGQVAITSQNHGFAVDPDTLPKAVEITHINLNDQTVEGMRHREMPVFSVQYHPEAAPGPNDAGYLFGEFAKMIEDFS